MRQDKRFTAKNVLTNPYYQYLRILGRPAKDALNAVRWFEAFRDRMEAEDRKDKEGEKQ